MAYYDSETCLPPRFKHAAESGQAWRMWANDGGEFEDEQPSAPKFCLVSSEPNSMDASSRCSCERDSEGTPSHLSSYHVAAGGLGCSQGTADRIAEAQGW